MKKRELEENKEEKNEEKENKEEKEEKEEKKGEVNGESEKKKRRVAQGPSLDFLKSDVEEAANSLCVVVGPRRPAPNQAREEEELFAQRAAEVEKERWRKLRGGEGEEGKAVAEREEWMLSLPSEERRNDLFTMLKRGNVKALGDGERAALDPSWTKTPGQKQQAIPKKKTAGNVSTDVGNSLQTKQLVEKYNVSTLLPSIIPNFVNVGINLYESKHSGQRVCWRCIWTLREIRKRPIRRKDSTERRTL